MEKYLFYIFELECNTKKLDELRGQLYMNGYNFLLEENTLKVYEEEKEYIESIMFEHGIPYLEIGVESLNIEKLKTQL